MGVRVLWDDTDPTAILYRFDASWTWQDFDDAIHRANTILSALRHRVHIILDMRYINWLPDGTLNYYRRLDDQAVSFNPGNVVVVRGERFSQAFWLYFWAIFSKTHQIPIDRDCVRFASSLQEARTIIASVHA